MAAQAFAHEPGGHRWQRVPPTERSGRVHTSTVTVAVLPEPSPCTLNLPDKDLDWKTTRGGGPGGQNVNKVETCVVLTHRPTGLVVRCQTERSQFRNKQLALEVLSARLQERIDSEAHGSRAGDRKAQVGSGMRGDKRRTIRTQDGQVHDHVTGRKWRYADYVAGKL
jgi:peptide chain release factor 1